MQRLLIILSLFFAWCGPAHAFYLSGSPPIVPAVPTITLPSTGLQALYSVVKYKFWNGNCLRVQRSSDSTQLDIGFVNGVCDIASAMAFAGSGTLSVVKWYDESGNANDATQSNVGIAPVFTNLNEINNIPGITNFNASGALILPNTLSTNTQSETVFAVHAPLSLGGGVVELNQTYAGGNVLLMGLGIFPDSILNAATFSSTNLYSNMQKPEVSVFTSGPSSKTYNLNEHLATGIGTTAANTTTGGFLENASNGYVYWGQEYTVAIYNTVIDQSTIQSNKNNLYSTFNISTNLQNQVIFDGDSITFGQGSTLGINNPVQASPLLKYPINIRNIGVSGFQLTTNLTNEPNSVLAAYDPSLTTSIVLIAGGINDIDAGTTGANLFNNTLVPYVSAAVSTGYKVIVGTLLCNSAATTGENTERQNYNTLVKANAVADNYTVADYDSIPQLQCPHTTGYSSDGLHPTTLGYSVMAPVAAGAINALLP